MSASQVPFARISADGESTPIDRAIAEETPIAIECNGIGYAVLMATPADLPDLAYGFALAERLIDRADDVIDVNEHATDAGIVLRVTLAERVAMRIVDRVRHRVSESACGLCGIENLEQALRPLPRVEPADIDDAAIFAALAQLDQHQPLHRQTGAVHAAAACTADGEPWLVREDVGRHNAFDKLIGAMLRAGADWDGGFALLTSRCSYELVEKAVLAGCPLLATISAPTTLAIARAAQAGLALRVLARRDALLAPR
ncbi:formate dehydrogenase accessory sulfurtransferase FdhD [Sphingomonas sp. S1-29]|nr:formate dehydrogenase accessory sulfurtransferase FdhD [Sphingomonas sp. S1-29]UZK68261.1 formate dehydrogenase accessory sulfurtransferase FdhD [Sphingomonas sp. S1-29]